MKSLPLACDLSVPMKPLLGSYLMVLGWILSQVSWPLKGKTKVWMWNDSRATRNNQITNLQASQLRFEFPVQIDRDIVIRCHTGQDYGNRVIGARNQFWLQSMRSWRRGPEKVWLGFGFSEYKIRPGYILVRDRVNNVLSSGLRRQQHVNSHIVIQTCRVGTGRSRVGAGLSCFPSCFVNSEEV